MPKNRLLVVGAGQWQVPMIVTAKSLGMEVAVIDRNPQTPGLALADVAKVIDTVDEKGALGFAKDFHIDGVVTMATDFAVPTVAYVAEALSLPSIPYAVAKRCVNKIAVRESLLAAGIVGPNFCVVPPGPIDLDQIPFGSPFVVKPPDNCGSKGVSLVRNKDDLGSAVESARSRSRIGHVLVEEFMTGQEVSVEGVVHRNRITIVAITDKIVTDPPYFVEVGHTVPSILGQDICDRIRDLVRNSLSILGVNNCAFHVEVKVTTEGPKIVEVGARLGGGAITSHLVPLATGVDLVRETIMVALGRTPNLMNRHKKGAAMRFIVPKPGRVVDVWDFSRLMEINGVREIWVGAKVGDEIRSLASSDDRIGFVVTQADTPSEAAILAERIRDRVKVEVA